MPFRRDSIDDQVGKQGLAVKPRCWLGPAHRSECPRPRRSIVALERLCTRQIHQIVVHLGYYVADHLNVPVLRVVLVHGGGQQHRVPEGVDELLQQVLVEL